MSKETEDFRLEYTDLNTRITSAFNKAVDIIGKMVYYVEDFEDDGEISDDDIPMYQDVSGCPTTYYIDNEGQTVQIYIKSISSEGLEVVEYGEEDKSLCIGFSELDGIHAKLEVLELIS